MIAIMPLDRHVVGRLPQASQQGYMLPRNPQRDVCFQVKLSSAMFFQSHEGLLGLKNKDAVRWQQLYAPAWWLHRGAK